MCKSYSEVDDESGSNCGYCKKRHIKTSCEGQKNECPDKLFYDRVADEEWCKKNILKKKESDNNCHTCLAAGTTACENDTKNFSCFVGE